MNTMTQLTVNFPVSTLMLSDAPPAATGSGFNVDAQGAGSFTGLSYSIPAHAKGSISIDIQVMAITSDQIKELHDLAMTMLSASARDTVTSHEQTSASANLSVFSLFGGGASASYSKTTDTMHSMGLTDDQISQLMDKMFDIASKMSHVKLNFEIDNSAYDYSVDGDLELYTLSGTIHTAKGDQQYRMLADNGTAGNQNAPAKGTISLS